MITNPFKPFIKDFEAEAESFLIKYGYEEALTKPQAIDIRDIVTRCMSLNIVESEFLSPDSSVRGIITFSKGTVQTYDWFDQEYVGYTVDEPTVLIDADILNAGYRNIILSHEAFHWYKHRQYFVYENSHGDGQEFAFRCNKDYSEPNNNGDWSDEQIMEWQARKIAPIILMPRNAFNEKVYSLSGWSKTDGILGIETEKNLISQLANFFQVTSYAVVCRLRSLGYVVSDDLFSYTFVPKSNMPKEKMNNRKQSPRITLLEAFDIYRNNPTFREYIDSGMFVFRDIGFFGRLETRSSNQPPFLTFEDKIVPSGNNSLETGVMFHKNQEYKNKKVFRNTPQNAALYNKQSEYAAAFYAEHERKSKMYKTANETLWEYMRDANWNTSIFQSKTLLSSMDYTRIQQANHKFKLPAYVAMAVGLKLSLIEFQDIIKLAGICFKTGDKTDDAYAFILSSMQGKSIDECNDFLESVGVPLLGTHDRKTTWDTPSFNRGD